MNRALATTAVTALVAGVAGGAIALAADGSPGDDHATQAAPATSAAAAGTPTAAELYKQDDPGVVVITAQETRKTQPSLFSPSQTEQVQSLGSGFVVDRRGDIVTNDHVVAGADSLRVGFGGGASYPAKVVGADPSSDLAVIRLDKVPAALHPLTFDTSRGVHPGDPVYAIGNPFGLDSTMTAGIVSATGRDIQAPDGLTIPDAIQTDAPINHGNSGGPLLDSAGQVIGINSQIESDSGDNSGIGFAVPSATAQRVADQIIAGKDVAHPYLGVQLSDAAEGGATVAAMSDDSPAGDAGVKSGDTITAVDGQGVDSADALVGLVQTHQPGDKLALTIRRGGDEKTVTVTLGNRAK